MHFDFQMTVPLAYHRSLIGRKGEAIRQFMSQHAVRVKVPDPEENNDQIAITGLEENLFPHSRSIDDPRQMEEERRLAYVGITRAKRYLYLLNARERTVFELKHYQGLKLRTIGDMLNTTEETAKNTLFRATRKLRLNLANVR